MEEYFSWACRPDDHLSEVESLVHVDNYNMANVSKLTMLLSYRINKLVVKMFQRTCPKVSLRPSLISIRQMVIIWWCHNNSIPHYVRNYPNESHRVAFVFYRSVLLHWVLTHSAANELSQASRKDQLMSRPKDYRQPHTISIDLHWKGYRLHDRSPKSPHHLQSSHRHDHPHQLDQRRVLHHYRQLAEMQTHLDELSTENQLRN